jgi:hypothetical protein
MMRTLKPCLLVPSLAVVLLAAVACGKPAVTDTSVRVSSPNEPGRGPGRSEASDKPTSIKAIMRRLTKGPQSLLSVMGEELGAAAPPWDTLQAQAKEFVDNAEALGKNSPPRGSKESWETQTAAFSNTSVVLEKAVGAKDKDKARDARQTLADSCMACHREHRRMGGPGRGLGGPGGFRGDDGPPDGGPGGPGRFGPRGNGRGGPGGGPSRPPDGGPDGPPPEGFGSGTQATL